jgi:hypothetical protein
MQPQGGPLTLDGIESSNGNLLLASDVRTASVENTAGYEAPKPSYGARKTHYSSRSKGHAHGGKHDDGYGGGDDSPMYPAPVPKDSYGGKDDDKDDKPEYKDYKGKHGGPTGPTGTQHRVNTGCQAGCASRGCCVACAC